jgi:hypothetical protein
MGLRRPRPTLRALARTPGFVACLATTIFTLYDALTFFAPKALRDPEMCALHYLNLHFQLVTHVGPAVAGSWLVLRLISRPRTVEIGADLLGYIVGLSWIGLFLLSTLLPWVDTMEHWL